MKLLNQILRPQLTYSLIWIICGLLMDTFEFFDYFASFNSKHQQQEQSNKNVFINKMFVYGDEIEFENYRYKTKIIGPVSPIAEAQILGQTTTTTTIINNDVEQQQLDNKKQDESIITSQTNQIQSFELVNKQEVNKLQEDKEESKVEYKEEEINANEVIVIQPEVLNFSTTAATISDNTTMLDVDNYNNITLVTTPTIIQTSVNQNQNHKNENNNKNRNNSLFESIAIGITTTTTTTLKPSTTTTIVLSQSSTAEEKSLQTRPHFITNNKFNEINYGRSQQQPQSLSYTLHHQQLASRSYYPSDNDYYPNHQNIRNNNKNNNYYYHSTTTPIPMRIETQIKQQQGRRPTITGIYGSRQSMRLQQNSPNSPNPPYQLELGYASSTREQEEQRRQHYQQQQLANRGPIEPGLNSFVVSSSSSLNQYLHLQDHPRLVTLRFGRPYNEHSLEWPCNDWRTNNNNCHLKNKKNFVPFQLEYDFVGTPQSLVLNVGDAARRFYNHIYRNRWTSNGDDRIQHRPLQIKRPNPVISYNAARMETTEYFPARYTDACIVVSYYWTGKGKKDLTIIQQNQEDVCIYSDSQQQEQQQEQQWKDIQLQVDLSYGDAKFILEWQFELAEPERTVRSESAARNDGLETDSRIIRINRFNDVIIQDYRELGFIAIRNFSIGYGQCEHNWAEECDVPLS